MIVQVSIGEEIRWNNSFYNTIVFAPGSYRIWYNKCRVGRDDFNSDDERLECTKC
jgi:hypothetical protein